jgi:hypothetical protein
MNQNAMRKAKYIAASQFTKIGELPAITATRSAQPNAGRFSVEFE